MHANNLLLLLVVVFLVIGPSAVEARQTIHIPLQEPTIQAGIDAATSGSTVVVAPGTYLEHDIDFKGKDIVVRGAGGADVTIVDAQGLGRGFLFQSGESPAAVLRGFTIQNGQAPHGVPGTNGLGGSAQGDGGPGEGGGGILVRASSPTILECELRSNRGGNGGAGGTGDQGVLFFPAGEGGDGGRGGDGGAIYVDLAPAAPRVLNCVFFDNAAGDGGPGAAGGLGGHGVDGVGSKFSGCLAFASSGGDGGDGGRGGNGGHGGAISVHLPGGGAAPGFVGCTLVANRAGLGGPFGTGGWGGSPGSVPKECWGSQPPISNGADGADGAPGGEGNGGGIYSDVFGGPLTPVVNCIVWNNSPSEDQLELFGTIDWSDVQGWGVGTNIDEDPDFVDEAAGDLRLLSSSPCIDGGSNAAATAKGICTDIAGNQRFFDFPFTPDTGDGTAPLIDIGPYEVGAWQSTLTADIESLSLSAGGAQSFVLDACEERAGEIYVILGSSTGNFPGTQIGDVFLPLNIVLDPFFDFTLANAGNPLFLPGTAGILDPNGNAAASFVLPPGSAPSAAGKLFHFASLIFDPVVLSTEASSNSVPLNALP